MNWKNWAVVLAAATLHAPAWAQYPDKPVRIIVPFGVGGSNDICQRVAAQNLQQITGKPFVVENKPGATGQIAYQAVATAPPDGYTLVSVDGSYPMLPFQFKTLAWDFEKDLVPISMYCKIAYVLTTSNASGIKSLKDLVARAKANPGKLNYGSGGVGNSNHLLTELISKQAGIQMTHVPFKGAGDANTALMAGNIDVNLAAVGTAIGQIKSGQIVALAVTSAERVPALPDVPTLTELGLPFEVFQWYGAMAPKGTPKAVVNYLQQEMLKMTKSKEFRDTMSARGFSPVDAMPGEALSKLIVSDTERWRNAFGAAGIKPE